MLGPVLRRRAPTIAVPLRGSGRSDADHDADPDLGDGSGDQLGWRVDDAPVRRPLTYPGKIPSGSILLTRHAQYELQLLPERRLGQARVVLGDDDDLPGGDYSYTDEVPLNYALLRFNRARADERVPVIAVGANAAPAHMRHKFIGPGVSLVVPLVAAEVAGLAAGVAADVHPAGYVPATPILGAELRSELFVQWFDSRQLATLDASLSGYRRVLLPAGDPGAGGVRVTLPSGEVLGACYAYVNVRGCLVDDDGPRRLGSQSDLIVDLLARSRRLRDRVGPTPQAWVERIGQAGGRDEVLEILAAEGWVVEQAPLAALATATGDGNDGSDGNDDTGRGRRGRPLVYGDIRPAVAPAPGSWRVMPSGTDVVRRAQAVVRMAEPIFDELGRPRHVAVRPVVVHPGDTDRLEALALVRVDESPDAPTDRIELDYVLRDAIGVELGEAVSLTPVEVPRRRWPDRIIGPPLYVTRRVQAADLSTAERDVCLLDGLTLELLGIQSGAEVVIEGRAGDDGVVEQIRLKAFGAPDAVRQTRESVEGGDFSVRYPSARDALGIHPDIPGVYLDKSTRALLGLADQKLATVRLRPSRAFQLRHEVREMLLILAIAFFGLVGLLTSTWAQGLVVGAMVGLVLVAIVVRMRGRLTHKVSRRRYRRSRSPSP
jgi:hypothetical protein